MIRDLPIGYIARNGAALRPDDTLEHAVEALSLSESGAVPVLESGRLSGLVTEREIALGLTTDPHTLVSSVMSQAAPIVPAAMPASVALKLMAEADCAALPVATEDGRFLGTVGRGELLAALFRRRRPASVGGMATPLGVYLSDGTYRGGAGDLALMLTGVFLFVGSVVASALAAATATAWKHSAWAGAFSAEWVSTATFVVAFALWFRMSWVAGLHAAEHQTVHAIERNERLTPERVAMMPRPHPRCGTNVVVLFSMFAALVGMLHVDDVLAGIISLVAYRFFGHWVQQYVTTRTATRRQLENGISAGTELLERYQNGAPPARFRPAWRVWNMGLVQVALGNAIPMVVLFALAPYVPFVRTLLRYLQ